MGVAQDCTDPGSQKIAFVFLGRCVSTWGRVSENQQESINGNKADYDSPDFLMGFDVFVQQELIPLAFKVPSAPDFNIKDGQMLLVSDTD